VMDLTGLVELLRMTLTSDDVDDDDDERIDFNMTSQAAR